MTYNAAQGVHRFAWWGRAGRTYFIQHSGDLIHWSYLPVIESGTNQPIEWAFAPSDERFFLRLKYTDIPTTDPFGADFDSDKVSNDDELRRGTDPFLALDSDGDGMPDDWELAWGFNPHDSSDASRDDDGDGKTNFEEFLAGTDPYDPNDGGGSGVPTAPASVTVVTNLDGSREVYWVDSSDNETYFVIRDHLPGGSTVELGRAGPGRTHLHIPAP